MAKTINKLIYNLRMQIKDDKSDDVKLTDRNIEFIINYIRAKLIRQDIQKGRSISSNITQSLGVIELEKVDASENNKFITGKNILRSVKEIPSPLDFEGTSLITDVSGLDGTSIIDFMQSAKANKRKNTKYASKRLAAYYDNNRLYLDNCNSMEIRYITASGVFEDPRAVSEFQNTDGSSCYDPNKDVYPMSSHMIDMMNSIIKNNELSHYFQLLRDNVNDGESND